MIILDNIIFSLQKTGGISRYWFELLTRFSIHNIDAFFVESSSICQYRNDFELSEKVVLKDRSYLMRRLTPKIDISTKKGIFHSSYFRLLKKPGLINCVTIYDMMPEIFKYNLRSKYQSLLKRRAIRGSDIIISISQNTKNDILKYYPEISEKKIKVIYLGVSHDFFKLTDEQVKFFKQKKGLSQPYILYIGPRNHYKNFDRFFQAYASLRYDRKIEADLVVVGGETEFSDEVHQLILKYKLADMVKKYSACSNAELNGFYNGAQAFFYPSLYEGFGIPLLEAMKTGTPVFCSNTSSLIEIAGPVAHTFDPLSQDHLREALVQVSKVFENEKRKELGITWAEKFSWDTCFTNTISLYKKIMSDQELA